jgi:uncharacterized OB-fold protein
MEVRTVEAWTRPRPAGEGAGGPFWAAAAQGRLIIQHCLACNTRQFYPRPLCVTCGADPEWEEASGRGVLHTFTVIRQNGAEPFRSDLPYIVGMVELEEGPRMMGNITGCDVDDVAIGMGLVAYSVKVSDQVAVVFWEPALPAD